MIPYRNQFNSFNKKHGYWVENIIGFYVYSWRGYYINGKRQGIWKCYEYGIVIKIFYYL